jgi:peroxiredoxin Q/BCP
MKIPDTGDIAPAFCLPDMDGRRICLEDFTGRWLVLYFYPKDNSSGCTLEAKDFSAETVSFGGLGAEVVGISPDSPESHRKFIQIQGLGIRLLSDQDKTVLEAYGVWKTKKLYGREYMGVERSTFLVGPDGRIAAAWRKVKVKGHAEEVRARLAELVAARDR